MRKKDKKQDKLITGTFIGNRNRYGFVEAEGYDDFFVPVKYTKKAFHKDEVLIEPLPGRMGKRPEARVVEIISHRVFSLTGTFNETEEFSFVRPDNMRIARDVRIVPGREGGAAQGDLVVVEILDHGSPDTPVLGEVTEVIGNVDEPYADIISVAKAYEVPVEFPESVSTEVKLIPDAVLPKEREGRLDLRDELIVSIDGDDSKDLDDAISLKKKGDNYILGVHIADVSHYVREKTALDKEAFNRSTSIYLLDVVIPMLPKELSNGICSLNPHVERLALSCIMEIDKRGRVTDHKIAESVIINKHRLTYSGVNRALDDPEGEDASNLKDIMDELRLMKELASILHLNRSKRGAVDFDQPESAIILNEKGYPVSVKKKDRGVSERIIEEFMLAANETIARIYKEKNYPFLYRSHGTPEPERVEELADLAASFGLAFKPGKDSVSPGQIQKLLLSAKGTDKEYLISTAALRSMQQACYNAYDSYHFGLAAKYYCHFTSPIRRYPDLLIHRIIKEDLKGGLSSRRSHHYGAFVPKAAEVTSRYERRAVECEREVDKLKKAQFMQDHIDEVYEGIISSVTDWGFYVMLDNTVEGLVPIHSIDKDYYIHNKKSYELVGEKKGRRFKLGDRVLISVYKVDTDLRAIDFRLVENGK